MSRVSRRDALAALAAGGAALGATPPVAAATATKTAATAATACDTAEPPRWARGIEGQRRADLGDGRYLNPILAGDHPDPSIARDGDDYYMTFSSFSAVPGLAIWHSRDLVNWTPRGPALRTPVGSVWAPELCRHDDRWFIYFHARAAGRRDIFVVHAPSIDGPWSEPLALGLPRHIDPGHALGEDGHRYLFLSGGDRVRLAADGLAIDGAVEHVYDPWRYPDDWVVEAFAPEGPKLLRRDGWFYLVAAVGGTAGPPTGHMVIAARSRSIHGPWEHAPHNPVVRTRDARERWWSRGHATLVEGPGGDWFMVYHGYENGYWTLGRQTLLDPIRWRADGWFEARGGDLSAPLPLPRGVRRRGAPPPHGRAHSDEFAGDRLADGWAFHDPGPGETARLTFDGDGLVVAGKGEAPADASPLCFVAGDRGYEFEVDVEVEPGARGGALLFYSPRLYCGLGFDADGLILHRYGTERRGTLPAGVTRRMQLRVRNEHHVVTIHHRVPGAEWRRHDVRMEVSGYHHNVAGEFLSLRPAIYAAGRGSVRFRALRYRALDDAGARDDDDASTAAAPVVAPVVAQAGDAAPDEVLRLWPDGAPGAAGVSVVEEIVARPPPPGLLDRIVRGVRTPLLEIFRAARPDGGAVLIVPGGGYRHVVIDKEGHETARWLAARGCTVGVLRYRLPGDGWEAGADAPLQDAQRALRLLRAEASRLGVDPARIGVQGFSAGGHLAARLAFEPGFASYAARDAADRGSARPDFVALIYPVVTMRLPDAHAGSRERLLGPAPSAALEARYSVEELVRADAPPVFLVHAADDPDVPVGNALQLYGALRRAAVATEMHLFAEAGHGFGLRYVAGKPVAAWPQLFHAWAARGGFLHGAD